MHILSCGDTSESVLTLERCCVWRGTWLVDHMCWTMGGQVRRAGLRVERFVE